MINDINKHETSYLYQNKSLKRTETDISQKFLDIKNHIKDKEEFFYDKNLLEKKNFIITPNLIERIKKFLIIYQEEYQFS